jgi:DNA-directed RNA polymerase specialized sigma24 family protein
MCEVCWNLLRDQDIDRAREGMITVIDHYALRLDAYLRCLRLQDVDRLEVAANCWPKVWFHRLEIPPGGELYWLLRVARNEAVSLFRTQRRLPPLIDPDLAAEQFIDPRPRPDQVVADCEQACAPDKPEASTTRRAQRLKELITQLPLIDQAIVQARCYPVTKPWTQVIFDTYPSRFRTHGAVRVQCVRILERLRKRLEDEGLL